MLHSAPWADRRDSLQAAGADRCALPRRVAPFGTDSVQFTCGGDAAGLIGGQGNEIQIQCGLRLDLCTGLRIGGDATGSASAATTCS